MAVSQNRILAQQEQLPLRVSYYLFPQRPGQELEDFQHWISSYQPGRDGDPARVNGYVLEGGGRRHSCCSQPLLSEQESNPVPLSSHIA
ncbi:MAG TPA: hypothetical protein VLV83_22080 [Acidobacteriota bacterium]|nr:hypothetical protein [Acidobacteriota bacterium]